MKEKIDKAHSMNIKEMNEKIIDQIKKARELEDKTQEDLANLLNKTRAAISDMERKKVQVSASELYIIAKFLNRPIEYFFGEDFGSKAVEDVIATAQIRDSETLNSILEDFRTTAKLSTINKKISKYKKIEDVPDELIKEFYDAYLPFSRNINKKVRIANETLEKLDKEMKTRGMKEFEIVEIKKK